MNTLKRFSFFVTTLTFLSLNGVNVMADSQVDKNTALIASFAEDVFGHKDFSNLSTYMHSDYIQHNPVVPQGREGFQAFFEDWFAKSPDFKYDLKKLIVNENHVWAYGEYSGTHTGDWLGIPATGEKYSFNAVDIFRVEDGKLAEHWDVLDLYTLFEQLGTVQ